MKYKTQPIYNPLNLGYHLIRHGFFKPKYILLWLCFFLNSIIVSGLFNFSLNVQSALNHDISRFLGAPLVIETNNSLPDSLWTKINAQPVKTTSMTQGAIGPSGYHSIALKSVSDSYPLQGKLIINQGTEPKNTTASKLKPLHAWLDQRAMDVFSIKPGDQLQVGTAVLTVDGKIITEPDRLTQMGHTLPRVMIRHDDLINTGINKNSGRTQFRYLFNDTPEKLSKLEKNLSQSIQQPFSVLKPQSGQHPFSRMASRTHNLLGIVIIFVMLLCGGAVTILTQHILQKNIFPMAVLKCMGIPGQCIGWGTFLPLFVIALVSAVMGTVIGVAMQPFLSDLLKPYLLINTTGYNHKTLLLTLFFNVLIVILFSYLKIRNLQNVSAINILTDRSADKSQNKLSFLLISCSTILLLWLYSDNTRLTVYLCIAVITVIVLVTVLGWSLHRLIAYLRYLSTGSLHMVMRSISRNPKRHFTTMVTISLTILAFSMTTTLRTSFLETYHSKKTQQDGDHLFTRLPDSQFDVFSQLLKKYDAKLKQAHPTVSAYLTSINGIPVDQALNQESDTREELRSPVRLSWSKKIPENNRLLEGAWPVQSDLAEVSVEAEVMTDLGLKIGDKLGFSIGSQKLNTIITSRREFKSGGSMITFWFMFNQHALEKFAQNKMGGFDVSSDQKLLLNDINQQFPNVFIINLKDELSRIRAIMTVITTLMNTVVIVLLMAAIMVMIASTFVSLQNHSQQINLLRAIGVNKRRIYFMNMLEHAIIGFMACLTGIAGTQLIAGIIFDQLFATKYESHLTDNSLLVMTLMACFLLIGWITGYLKMRRPINIFQQL